MKNIRDIAFVLVAAFAITTTQAQEKGFKIDEKTGVQYRFIKQNKSGAKFAENEFASIVMLWTGKNASGKADSVYFDSHKLGGDSATGAISIPVHSSYRGSLEDGIMMMQEGDSAVFKVNADSLFIKGFHATPAQIPHFITGSTLFTFNIKVLSFQTKESVMAKRQAEMKKRAAARQAQETKDITAYLQKNNLNVKPDADSIFYLQSTKGTGMQVEEGDSLEISYRGVFLDGTGFDPAPGSGKTKNSFKIVYSKNMSLIPGWVKILGGMSQGGKVTVLIPSKMAYGVRGMGPIQPYTPLIFDMELISVKSAK